MRVAFNRPKRLSEERGFWEFWINSRAWMVATSIIMSITELDKLFAQPDESLPQDVSAELQSISRLHSLSEEELFFKWEAYSMKLGSENTNLDYKTVRDFKKDIQDALERESRGKVHVASASKRGHAGTPRASTGNDVYGV